MRGRDVKEIQWLLNGHDPSAWQKKDVQYPIIYHFPIDGVFGRQTANRVFRAQSWLGYEHPSRAAGQDFYDFMIGKKKLTKEMQHRRGERIREAKKSTGKKAGAVEALRKHMGLGESPPGSNCQMFGSWYHMNCVAWCAISCSWAFDQVGIHFRHSYVPEILDDARWGREGLHITGFPEKGDLFIVPPAVHVGFFDKWGSGGYFHTVEGNHGDHVAADYRHRSSIQAFIRVEGPRHA